MIEVNTFNKPMENKANEIYLPIIVTVIATGFEFDVD